MGPLDLFGTRLLAGDQATPPTADNDNWGVCSERQTPAEVLQIMRRYKAQMRKELSADFRLRHCPKHRQDWEILVAIEKCTLWHFYGVRD